MANDLAARGDDKLYGYALPRPHASKFWSEAPLLLGKCHLRRDVDHRNSVIFNPSFRSRNGSFAVQTKSRAESLDLWKLPLLLDAHRSVGFPTLGSWWKTAIIAGLAGLGIEADGKPYTLRAQLLRPSARLGIV